MNPEPKTSRNGDPGNLLLIVYILAVIVFLLAGTFSQSSAMTDAAEEKTVTFSNVKSGELLFVTETAGHFLRAPRLSQEVEISVSGMVINSLVKQRFINEGDNWVEAVYAFPLPDESGVHHMRMVVGDRVIIGEIKEKEKARAVYEQAKREGKKASLLAQKRPNLFTMAVANIAPGTAIDVEIEYIDTVRLDDGVFSLRFPMVIGPRYIPGSSIEQHKRISFDEGGWATDTDQVSDASQITPPVAASDQPALNPVKLSLSLAPGFPVQGLTSLYHGVNKEKTNDNSYLLSFNGQVFADRDFVVEYRAANEKEVAASLFTEQHQEKNYQLLMLMPPVVIQDNQVPREVIFILDISGSMAGVSIDQAKKALQLAVSRLHKKDRFNIIVFNNSATKFYPTPVSASEQNREITVKKIATLSADGGTEIAPALRMALDGRKNNTRIRQVVFLTDGAVGNERALFSLIHDRLGDSRLFTVGIGSAPNSFFMSRAALMGRGSYSFIGKIDEVDEKMAFLFKKLEHPVVSHLEIETDDGHRLEMYPHPLPDLYAGEPLVTLIRNEKQSGALRLRGVYMGRPWSVDVETHTGKKSPGIALLWARKKIKSLMDDLSLGAAEQEVRRQVVATALSHHLVSRYTSLVAVERRVSRPNSENMMTKQVQTNLPKGWQHKKVFGTGAKTATNSRMLILTGILLMLLSLILFKKQWRRG